MFILNGITGLTLLAYLINKQKLGIYPLFLSVYLLVYVLVPYLASTGVLDRYASGGFVKVMSHFESLSDYFFHANLLVLSGILVIYLMSFYTPKKGGKKKF